MGKDVKYWLVRYSRRIRIEGDTIYSFIHREIEVECGDDEFNIADKKCPPGWENPILLGIGQETPRDVSTWETI